MGKPPTNQPPQPPTRAGGCHFTPYRSFSDWAAITAENWSLLGCGAGLLVSDILIECITFLLKGPGIVLGSRDPWE
jgi:hypothetical protein